MGTVADPLVQVNELSQAPVLIGDSHAQVESPAGGIDASIEATDPNAQQFIPDAMAGAGVDAEVEEVLNLERGGEAHGSVVVN